MLFSKISNEPMLWEVFESGALSHEEGDTDIFETESETDKNRSSEFGFNLNSSHLVIKRNKLKFTVNGGTGFRGLQHA